MKREIKYRAFDDGKILYSHNNSFNDDATQLGWFFGRLREDAIIMQFTGLKDINGKEVYEGDINHQGYVIRWNQLHNCFGWFNSNGFISEILSDVYDNKGELTYYHLNCPILGNINENPELL